MQDLTTGLIEAFKLIAGFDADLLEIIAMTLRVSLVAVCVATVLGLSLGAVLAVTRFPGRMLVIVLLNALMGLPPVVVGLVVYLALSRAGPFGVLGLLFTPTAMIIAQTLLVLPIIAAVSRQILADLWIEYREQLMSFGASRMQRTMTLVWDARFQLLTAVLAGFGRAIAEVGAVMIVGGNIEHATRVMTTAIALETSKGNLSLAIGLGIILVCISLIVNGLLFVLQPKRAVLP
jgi:tungstate transport system permease protein